MSWFIKNKTQNIMNEEDIYYNAWNCRITTKLLPAQKCTWIGTVRVMLDKTMLHNLKFLFEIGQSNGEIRQSIF